MQRLTYKDRVKLAKKQARQTKRRQKVGEIIKILPAVVVLIGVLAVAGYIDQQALNNGIIS